MPTNWLALLMPAALWAQSDELFMNKPLPLLHHPKGYYALRLPRGFEGMAGRLEGGIIIPGKPVHFQQICAPRRGIR